jgi:hypothetical protein
MHATCAEIPFVNASNSYIYDDKSIDMTKNVGRTGGATGS